MKDLTRDFTKGNSQFQVQLTSDILDPWSPFKLNLAAVQAYHDPTFPLWKMRAATGN